MLYVSWVLSSSVASKSTSSFVPDSSALRDFHLVLTAQKAGCKEVFFHNINVQLYLVLEDSITRSYNKVENSLGCVSQVFRQAHWARVPI